MRYLVETLCVLVLVVMPTACGGDGNSGVCESFCAKEAECYPPEEQIPRCEQYCRYVLDVSADTSSECESAAAGAFECVGDLPTCEDVDAYWFEEPFDSYPCKAADDNFESACF